MMPFGHLYLEIFQVCPTGTKPLGHLAWEHLGVSHWELEEVAREKDV